MRNQGEVTEKAHGLYGNSSGRGSGKIGGKEDRVEMVGGT